MKSRYGEVIIDGSRFSSDVIIYPDHVEDHWWRREGHSLHPSDIENLLRQPPEVLVIGQGNVSRMEVPAETRRKLEEAGIETFKTGETMQEGDS